MATYTMKKIMKADANNSHHKTDSQRFKASSKKLKSLREEWIIKVNKIKTKVELINIESSQNEEKEAVKSGINAVYSSRSIDALKRRKSLEENQGKAPKKQELKPKANYSTNQVVSSRLKTTIPIFTKPKQDSWRTHKFRLQRKTDNLSLIQTDKSNTVVCPRSHSEENETSEIPQYDENLSGFIKLPRRKSTKSMKHCGVSKERGNSLVKINKIENKYQACFRAHKKINLLDNDSSSDDDDSFKMTIHQAKKDSSKKKKLKDYRIQNKPSKECCKFVILTKIDLSDNNTPTDQKEISLSKKFSYPISKPFTTTQLKIASARSGNQTSTTSNSSSQERIGKAQRCFSERKDSPQKDHFDSEKFKSVNANRSGLNAMKTSSGYRLIELLDNDKQSKYKSSKNDSSSQGKHIRRYKSITESFKTESNLESKIEKAIGITYDSKFSKELELGIHNFEEFPSYIGYYFRKAYSQAYESLRCSVNASLHDPFDSNKMTMDDFTRNVSLHNADLRSSASKIDMENHRSIENAVYSKLPVYQLNIDDLDMDNFEEKKEIPIQSQEIVRSNEEHVVMTLQSLEYVSHLKIPENGCYLTGKEAIFKTDHKKLLILDMDETIIHTLYKKNRNNYGFDETNQSYDAQVPVINPDGSTRYLYINIRPYVKEVLKELK